MYILTCKVPKSQNRAGKENPINNLKVDVLFGKGP